MSNLSVVLVEDHLLVRNGIRMMLEQDPRFLIIGEFGDAELFLQHLESQQPDIIVMDISLPGMNGMQATAIVKEKFPDIRVLILSMFTEIEYIQQCLDHEVSGYIIKGSGTQDFKSAFDALHEGKTFFSEEIHQKVMESYKNKKIVRQKKEQIKLTAREQEILKNLSEGKTNLQISNELFISERTVEAHRANIMKKINAHNTAELIAKAFRLGVID